MAKKPKVNKTKAVAAYMKAHRGATVPEIVEGLGKEGITITASHVYNIKGNLQKRRTARKAAATPTAVPVAAATEPAAAPAEKKADTIALEHVRAVARTVQAMGGFDKLNELLSVIKEVGGMKKFKDLLDAMAGPKEDKIPF